MSETLRPFERRYSDEQIRAVVHACLDSTAKLNPRQAAQRAAAGTLPGSADLPPFGKEQRADGSWHPTPEQTIYGWLRRERRDRGEKQHGRLASVQGGAMPIVIGEAWDDLEQARDMARRKTMTPLQRMKHVREYVATAALIEKAEQDLRKRRGAPAGAANERPSEPKPERNAEADALTREARARARTEQHETHTHQGSVPVTELDHVGRSTDEQPDSVARERSATQLNGASSTIQR